MAKIRFTSCNEIFISVFNRLDSLVRHYIIPSDYKKLCSNQRTVIIKTQPKSLEENEVVKLGFYDWQEILPQGNNWSGIEIIKKKKFK